jgi:hypothetical protein
LNRYHAQCSSSGILISGAALKIRVSRIPITLFLLLSLLLPLAAFDQPVARPVADWIASGVIYEINPRTFSAAGNFRGIESKLDDLKDLGATILWLMPIHPVGQLKKKGTIGSAYAVQDYYGINPSTARRGLQHPPLKPKARPEDHRRHRRQPHRVGQRAHEAPRVL